MYYTPFVIIVNMILKKTLLIATLSFLNLLFIIKYKNFNLRESLTLILGKETYWRKNNFSKLYYFRLRGIILI